MGLMGEDGWSIMFKVKAYVSEIEPDSLYEVDIDGFKTAVAACSAMDNMVGFIYRLMRFVSENPERFYGEEWW